MARTRFTLGAAAALALMAAAGSAAAADVMDRIFSPGQLNGLAPEQTLVYDYVRHSRDPERLGQDFDDSATLTLRPDDSGAVKAVVVLMSETRRRQLDPFPASASNPLLLAFLESSLRSVAQATGGSPFYIRNRVKDAMRAAGEIEPVETESGGHALTAERIMLRPFVADSHREQLGAFADLVYEIVLSDAAPGGVVSLSATAEGADGVVYQETMTLTDGTGEKEAK